MFAVLSPIIILYVTGRTLPFFDPNPTNTGIIDVQSEPNGATVFLNDEESGSTPATIRFVKQGWQNVRVSLEGYRPWQKQLFIEAGQVIYAGSINDAIRLLPEAEPSVVDTKVGATVLRDNQILYAKDQQLILYDIANKQATSQTTLPFSITSLQSTPNRDLWIANTSQNQKYLINSTNWQTATMPNIFNKAEQIFLVDSTTISGLIEDKLIIAKLGSNQPQTSLSNVLGYTFKDGLFYVATKTQTNAQLATYGWTGSELNQQLVILSEGLPENQLLQFYITNQKELFLLAGESFYRVNQSLELLNNFVKIVDLDTNSQRLTFVTPTEIYFYNFNSNRSELLARTTENLTAGSVIPSFGYGFFAGPGGAEAIEIDSRGNQNRYVLFPEPSQQLLITANQKFVVVKSNNNLYTVAIQK